MAFNKSIKGKFIKMYPMLEPRTAHTVWLPQHSTLYNNEDVCTTVYVYSLTIHFKTQLI